MTKKENKFNTYRCFKKWFLFIWWQTFVNWLMPVIKQWWGRCTTRSTKWTIYQQNFLADFPASQCSRGSWKPWEFFCTIRTWSLRCPQKKKLYNNLLPLRIEEIFLILLKCNFCFEILYIFLLISGITGKGGG